MNWGGLWLLRSHQVREGLRSVPLDLTIGTSQMLISGPESSSKGMNGDLCSPKKGLTLEKALWKQAHETVVSHLTRNLPLRSESHRDIFLHFAQGYPTILIIFTEVSLPLQINK